MAYTIEFEKLISYEAGEAGISLDVELRLGVDSIAFEAKIDTGASFCVFERKHGEEIGIEVETGLRNRVGTATGSFRVFGHQLTLTIENYEFDAMVYFAEDENFNRNVLGRRGGLENLRIGIIDYDGKLYLSRYESE
ncbi:MAG: retropepsin-like domain-containing protein [Pyrinomonadaceae bacterium]|nr:retropepsin-like domain-containing protein [Pyrinomonadaceae bacterium]